MKARNIAYWITTIVLAFCILSGGAAETVHYQANVEGIIVRLGYPLYFLTIIGIWKVLGAIAIVIPKFPRLKEWAYAGIFFIVTGAAASHAAVGLRVLRIPCGGQPGLRRPCPGHCVHQAASSGATCSKSGGLQCICGPVRSTAAVPASNRAPSMPSKGETPTNGSLLSPLGGTRLISWMPSMPRSR